jgi:hypothetical protein
MRFLKYYILRARVERRFSAASAANKTTAAILARCCGCWLICKNRFLPDLLKSGHACPSVTDPYDMRHSTNG